MLVGEEYELGELDDGEAHSERQAYGGRNNRECQEEAAATQRHGEFVRHGG